MNSDDFLLPAPASPHLSERPARSEEASRVEALVAELARVRQENEERHALFARIFEAIRPLRRAVEVVRAVTRVTGEHFRADRCSYSEVSAAGTHTTVLPDWMRQDLPSIAGEHELDSYGTQMIAAMRAGQVIAIADIEEFAATGTPAARAAWEAVQTRAMIIVPLIKENRLAANFFLLTRAPRAWTETEVALAKEIAEQTWSALAAARAAEELRATEERSRRDAAQHQAIYETALSNIEDFAYIFDLEGRFVYANRALLALLGLPREEVHGKTFHELPYPSELAARLVRQIQEVITTRTPLRDETPFASPNGQQGLYEYIFSPAFNAAGEVTAVVGTTRDITARWAEAELVRASRDQFQQIADTAPAMLWITEPDGACTFRSRSWSEFTGQTPEDGFGLGWTDAIHPEDRTAAARTFLEANARREPFARDCRVRRADGEFRWAVDAGRPRFTEGGEFLGFIGSVIDIHERKVAEAALAEQAAALRDADRRKDEFLAMLAHELRNPLASVTSAVTLLKEADDADNRAWARNVIERQSQQLARLVDDLLDVSRITRGKIELRRTMLDAAVSLESACEAVAPLIAERAQTLEMAIPRGELWLQADPTRLEQIVVNLLANAARYTEPRGRLELTAWCEAETVVIAVRDWGIGIAPERIGEMFELFAQGDRPLARSEGGLGIGLTVARSLCELHGGSLSAHSEGPGCGSTFTVRLPAVARLKSADSSPSGSSVPAVPDDAGTRVLVVDDNADTAAGLNRLLTRRGYAVSLAHDGPSALAQAREFCPAVVLLDIGLPGMDGYEVARRLRQEPCGAEALLIAISGYGQDEDRAKSRAAGFDHHLVKPVSFEQLRTLLARCLSLDREA